MKGEIDFEFENPGLRYKVSHDTFVQFSMRSGLFLTSVR